MALARNLNKKRFNLKLPKLPKLNKWAWVGILAGAFLILVFGAVLLLPHLFTQKKDKAEIKYETGDRPLPQKLSLWVTAEGGLFMRETPDSKSQAVLLIPNGTELSAEETSGEWYRVLYRGKSGWVNRAYVTTQAPAQDPLKGWLTFQNKNAGYSLRHQADWVAQDYGANPATGSENYVGLGPQLSPTLDPSKSPPVVIRTTKRPLTDVEAEYAKQSNVVTEAVNIAGIPGKRFIYNANSGVQMTTCVIGKGATVYIFEETGGFSDELSKIIGTVILS